MVLNMYIPSFFKDAYIFVTVIVMELEYSLVCRRSLPNGTTDYNVIGDCMINNKINYVRVATMAMFLGDITGSKVGTSLAECTPLSSNIDNQSLRIRVSNTPCMHV